MDVSIKELRTQAGRIVSMASSGNDITITFRGKPAAKIVPLDYAAPKEGADDSLSAFGMWKNLIPIRSWNNSTNRVYRGTKYLTKT